jgi:hypothetical protein
MPMTEADICTGINCTISSELCESFHTPVRYPCLKYFDSKAAIDYYGVYNHKGIFLSSATQDCFVEIIGDSAIMENVRRFAGPAMSALKSTQQVLDFVDNQELEKKIIIIETFLSFRFYQRISYNVL